MRSVLLSLTLVAGTLGIALAEPAQARADELVGPAIANGNTMPVSHHGWYGGWGGRGFSRGYYPGFGYSRGFSRGYYPYGGGFYPYGGYRSRYYGGGFYPYGGYGAWPYSGFYGPGFYW
ncbi:MAG TPA: hypothetical protein VH592_12275 [Gemmataceae bacterium]|jgi:hypothetical protein